MIKIDNKLGLRCANLWSIKVQLTHLEATVVVDFVVVVCDFLLLFSILPSSASTSTKIRLRLALISISPPTHLNVEV